MKNDYYIRRQLSQKIDVFVEISNIFAFLIEIQIIMYRIVNIFYRFLI